MHTEARRHHEGKSAIPFELLLASYCMRATLRVSASSMHEVASIDSFLQYHAGRKQWHGSRAVEFLHAAQRGEQAPRLLPRLLILPLRPLPLTLHAIKPCMPCAANDRRPRQTRNPRRQWQWQHPQRPASSIIIPTPHHGSYRNNVHSSQAPSPVNNESMHACKLHTLPPPKEFLVTASNNESRITLFTSRAVPGSSELS